jgi:hypothetical protein
MENHLLTTQERTVMPDRQELRALFDEEADAISMKNDLNTPWHRKLRDAVFEACYTALGDYRSRKRRLLTVSAPPGAGKTSFACAFIVAMTRYAERHPEAPQGCVFVTDRIQRADEVYRDLEVTLPGKVAIWTSEHKDLFSREVLRHYTVVVVTGQFYLGPNGHLAHSVNNRGHFQKRALTIVDERPEEVTTYEILLSQAQKVREVLTETHPDTKEHMDSLLRFMEQYSYKPTNKIYLPEETSDKLAWFTEGEAERLAKQDIPGIDQLFGFAKALDQGCGFVVSEGKLVRYLGYASKLTVKLSAGAVLFDATADIDGLSQIVPHRVTIEAPQARYDHLEIVHVPQHTTKNLKRYFSTAPNQKSYVKWMTQIIEEHMEPGEFGLVICKKVLLDQQRVPNWPEDDQRFKNPEGFTKNYEWDLGGRKLCVVHWGTGIGSNDWKDADVVFHCDEFFIPRRTAAANVQGLREHRVHEGDLGAMTTPTSGAPGVDLYQLGNRLRWTKQMALRGRARCYDEHGVCGKMRLVVASELESFIANVGRLFPGAKVRLAGDDAKGTWAERVLRLLKGSEGPLVTTSDLGDRLHREWRKISRDVLTPEFLAALDGMGWRYVTGKGRSGSRFERKLADAQRMEADEALAA